MSLLAKRIGELTEDDLAQLIATQESESRILDYKRDTIGVGDKDRYEFLADISSFANSSGGELILGIDETNGLPSQLVGINVSNVDQEILRLEQMARTGIRPLIHGIETRAIPLKNAKPAIVIRIPKSWAAPHQIGQPGSFRFFGRSSNGKYQLDVDALRSLFQQGPDIAERVRIFRAERLGKIISNDMPTNVASGSKIVVHVVPLDNFSTKAPIDMRFDRNVLLSLLEYGNSVRVNLDGYIARVHMSGSLDRAYAQLFRDAVIEIVQSVERWDVRGHNFLPGQAFDEILHRIVSGVKRTYALLGVRPPIAFLVALLDMEDRLMGAGNLYGYESERPFGRKEMVCPEVIISDLTDHESKIAFPIVNLVWNAAGYEQSVFYDKEGNWKGK
jgi:hypothetical protein